MTNFYVPRLSAVSLPMPTTQSTKSYSVGKTLFTPGGFPRTQRQFTGIIVSMSWDKLSDGDRTTLEGQISSVGFTPVALRLTDGSTEIDVIPNSFEAYSEEKFEHFVADSVRWDCSMTWKEVPT